MCVYTRRVSYCISDRTLEATFGFTLQHARFPSLLLREVEREGGAGRKLYQSFNIPDLIRTIFIRGEFTAPTYE